MPTALLIFTFAAWQNPLPPRWPLLLRGRQQRDPQELLSAIWRGGHYLGCEEQRTAYRSVSQAGSWMGTPAWWEYWECSSRWPTMGLCWIDCTVPSRGVSRCPACYLCQYTTNFSQQKSPGWCNCVHARPYHVWYCWAEVVPKCSSSSACRCIVTTDAPECNRNRGKALVIPFWYPYMSHVYFKGCFFIDFILHSVRVQHYWTYISQTYPCHVTAMRCHL